MAKISVIIPCFNAAKHLGRTMDSFITQTMGMDNLEIILVDDASTDGGATLDMCMEYEGRYPENIIVIPLEENMRQGGARNIALIYASGDYVLYCDSDDWLVPKALERLYDIAVQYDCDVVEFDNIDTASYDVSDEIVRYGDMDDEYWEINTVDERREYVVGNRTTPGCWNKLYRRPMLVENNIRYAEHVIYEEPAFTYMVRFVEKKHYYVHEVLHYCYLHTGSTMRSDYESRKFDNMKTIDELYCNLVDKGFMNEYSEEIEYIFWYWYFFSGCCFAAGKLTFFTADEFAGLKEHTAEIVKDIRINKYFKRKFENLTALGDLTYLEMNRLNMDSVYSVFRRFVS